MANRRVFLTGATGTVGGAVLEVLASLGTYSVDCLVRSDAGRRRAEGAGARAIMGDMTDSALFTGLVGRTEYDAVIHAAQASYVDFTPQQNDIMDRKAVANLARLRTDATRAMLYTSGVWIFGGQPFGARITEETPRRPFELDRPRAEFIAAMRADGDSPWTHVCPPSIVYGAAGAIPAIVRGLGRGPIDVIDDDTVLWSVVERLDLGRAYEALLDRAAPRDLFLVAEDDPVPSAEFHEAIARRVPGGRAIRRPREYFASQRDAAHMEPLYGSQPVDAAKIKAWTGWEARESFRSSVGKYVV